MPIYEYYCPDCQEKFEVLRPLRRIDDPAACPSGHREGQRVLSVFAALSREEGGEALPITGGACCAGGQCSCGASHN